MASLLAGFPPKVFIIGAQKAGTTFLAALLDQHAVVRLAVPKEPHYFTRHRHKDLDWYRQFFTGASPEQILVDATPGYAAAHLDEVDDSDAPYARIPERIAAVSPGARFIYVVRDPVARMYSAYWHNVRVGHERRSFEDAIEVDSHYRRVSDYAGQLERYLAVFPRERILVLRFEDLVEQPLLTANTCFEWLDLAPLGSLQQTQPRNRSFVYPWPLRAVDRALRPVGGMKRVVGMARSVVPDAWVRAAGNKMTRKIPPLDAVTRERLLTEFEPRARAFKEQTDLVVHPWRSDLTRPFAGH